ncbi:transketolase C-terminal domain-containing protein [Aeromicrobium sp.]|uniref:transketolase C-terminal domain-containing protein n=1 Tax=Aeromicrobium sp. TaxID=1871063 RepID=UPI003D6BF961
MESIDEHFVRQVRAWDEREGTLVLAPNDRARLIAYFEAQVTSRHTDFACRELQSRGEGFYTIGSAGHEANAAVAMALQPTDPALLHYRSGGFYVARAAQVPGVSAVDDILSGAMSSVSDGISGGRHKVFGSVPLNVIPQTSTIASHLPRAFGLAYAMDHPVRRELVSPWPDDAVVICSFGDASVNHSTALGAFNVSSYCAHRGIPLPIVFVCEDNGIGISTKSPSGWVAKLLRSLPGLDCHAGSGSEPVELLQTTSQLVEGVRASRRPAVLHLRTVRFMGHAGSDAEIAYRSMREIEGDYGRDPLLATARALVDARVMKPDEVLERYELARVEVADRASRIPRDRLSSASAVTAPIARREPADVRATAGRHAPNRRDVFGSRPPEVDAPQTLALAINAALKDTLAAHGQTLVFGQDVARKGGVYGVTRGLVKTFGRDRVFDTLLDEQTVLGTALGSALAGFLPIPEIQYLAYVHNTEDQLRGEAATLKFFSDGQYQNGMVVRIAGLAYQKGFGGHFHNDNSVAVLRDIPGLMLAVPSHPATAPGLLRQCVALALEEGRVCVYLEPIALYHQRDLHDGDSAWLAQYAQPNQWQGDTSCDLGRLRNVRQGDDVLIVTFGNGVRMSLLAAATLQEEGVECAVVDLQWLAPLPVDELLEQAQQHTRILVVDETRHSGGVSESVVTALVDGGYGGRISRVTSADSFIPLGPAADHVLLSVQDIVDAALAMKGE